jgi:hypothetical protein
MPIYGTLALEQYAGTAPVTGELAFEEWETDQAEALTLNYEVEDTYRLEMLPAALHPAIPLYAQITVRKHESSPVGAFNLAEVRLMTRAGSHYGGYTIGAFANTQESVEFLRSRYGWAASLGDVTLNQRHFGAHAHVELDGRCVLEMSLKHPQPITPADLLVTAGFHLAQVGSDLRLIQSEPSYEIEMVQRGEPNLTTLDSEAFGDARVQARNPIVATYLKGSFKLGRVRYLIDPTRPATEGTEQI